MLRCHEGKCSLCRRHTCICECEELREMSCAEKAEHHELCNDGHWFKVVPFEFRNGINGGTSYSIVKCKTMATSKDKDNAEEIVRRLNLARKAERDNNRLVAENRRLQSTFRGRHSSEDVRQAVIDEFAVLPHCRWSSHRKQIVDFGRAVLRRLKVADDQSIGGES